VPWSLDGRPPNVHGASQPIDGERESRRSTTPVSHWHTSGRTSPRESSTGSLRPGRRAVQKRALGESEGREPARRPAAPLQSSSQVNPGGTADNNERHAIERLRPHTCGGGPLRQTTTICIKAGKPVRWLQGQKVLALPYTWCIGRQSGRDWAHAQQERRDIVLPRPRGEASSPDHYTGRRPRNKESRQAMGKTRGKQCGIWHLDVVDGWISNGLWKSRSRSCVLKQRQLDGLPQLPRHWTNGGVRCRTVGNRSRTPQVRWKSGGATCTPSHDSGSF